MGGLMRQQSGWVWRVDFKNQLIYIIGRISGTLGSFITLEDSSTRKFDYWYGAPPYPTFSPPEDEDVSQLTWEECQLVSKSRIGFPSDMHQMPAPEVVEANRYAAKQTELMKNQVIDLKY